MLSWPIGSAPIGRPYINTTIHLLADPTDANEVPLGQVGEMYIGMPYCPFTYQYQYQHQPKIKPFCFE
jgi:hypothetical protein